MDNLDMFQDYKRLSDNINDQSLFNTYLHEMITKNATCIMSFIKFAIRTSNKEMVVLRGYNIDGTITTGLKPIKPYVVISGRKFGEYNDVTKNLAATAPVYIRGCGAYGDQRNAGKFKAEMINMLGIAEFYEDDMVHLGVKRLTTGTIFRVFPDGSFE